MGSSNDGSDSTQSVVDDPTESHDLAGQNPALLARLVAVLDAIPEVPSRAEAPDAPRPESLFRSADNTWNYDVRVPETRAPWAEAAVRSQQKR
jgi:hypothetical protein